MEKRLALAIVLVLLLFYVTNKMWGPKEQPVKNTNRNIESNEEKTADNRKTSGATPQIEAADPENIEKKTQEETDAKVAGAYESTGDLNLEVKNDIVVETDNYLATFSNYGASLKSLKFKHYFISSDIQMDEERMDDPNNWLDIMYDVQKGKPSFLLNELGQKFKMNTSCWEHILKQGEGGENELVFTYKAENGLIFKKVFTFHNGVDAYHFDVKVELENRNPALDEILTIDLTGPCGIKDEKRPSFTTGPEGVIKKTIRESGSFKSELDRYVAGDLEDTDSGIGHPIGITNFSETILEYGGIGTNFFALLLKPYQEEGMLTQFRLNALLDSSKVEEKVREFSAANNGALPGPGRIRGFEEQSRTNVETSMRFKTKVPVVGDRVAQSFMFFAGPKSTKLTDRQEYSEFYSLIEDGYGNFKWINTSLIWILQFFYSFFSNWGVSIIFMTLVVKIMLFPFNRMQQVSMHSYGEKMKKLKPKLDEVKKKYKNNKKKFNEAQMKLMKEEGVRPPLMGCMLMFVQFPIFIGLFQILRQFFELRHSPFVGWVKDLSQADALPLPFSLPFLGDTLNVLPILMTVAFYYQQKMMPKPTGGDAQAEQMQKIMRFMPIIFGVMFYGYASGLSLYWMTSNLISIMEYRFIRKKFPVGPKPEDQSPPPLVENKPEQKKIEGKTEGTKKKSGKKK